MVQMQLWGLNLPKTLAAFFFLCYLCAPVTGMNCYQCNSTLDNNCQEKWDDRLATNRDKYRECDMWDAQYCVKITGLWGGVVGAHRFCSSRDMGDQCQDIWYPDHDRIYRACVYTCSDDGCNSAAQLSTVFTVVSSVVGLVVALWRTL